MARMVVALLGASLVVIVSFFLSLKAIDHFGLFRPQSVPFVSITVDGKDSIAISPGTPYQVAYTSSGARSCEMVYRNSDDGSSGRYSVPPNRSGTENTRLIGSYTLTCIGLDGATTSKSIAISRR
jgi:hypothetical protein